MEWIYGIGGFIKFVFVFLGKCQRKEKGVLHQKTVSAQRLAPFLKKVISKCPSNDFLHHDLQFVMLIMMLIDSVTFMYVFFVSDYICLFNYVQSYEN